MSHIELLRIAISEFVREYQANPFKFLYERDLQALLYAITLRHCSQDGVQIRGGYHLLPAYGGKDYIETAPVHCEYPALQAFDVALIDAGAVEHYDQALTQQLGWKNDRFWNQPVGAAIEMKYYQLGDSPGKKASEFKKDVGKLRSYRDGARRPFLGIALMCVQSDSLKAAPFCVGQELNPYQPFPIDGVFRYVVTPSSTRNFAA